VLSRKIVLAYQGCFAEWSALEKGGAAVLLGEFGVGVMDRLAGLHGILITYTLQAVGASHNVQVLGLSPVLRTEAMGNKPMTATFDSQPDHVPGDPYLIIN